MNKTLQILNIILIRKEAEDFDDIAKKGRVDENSLQKKALKTIKSNIEKIKRIKFNLEIY